MKPVILLVDDEHDLVTMLAEVLTHRRTDHDVLVATSFDEADQTLQMLEVDGRDLALLVLDHALDGRTGLELIEANQQQLASTPRILYTGQATQEITRAAEQLNATVMWKPAPLQQWLTAVEQALS